MRSIVSAVTFHFSVRNGKRWCHNASITRKFLSVKERFFRFLVPSRPCGLPGMSSLFLRIAPKKVKRKCQKIYSSTISKGKLNMLPRFYCPPINLVVFQGSFSPHGPSKSYLGDGFPLRCFQRLSDGNLATRQCPLSWNNRHTRDSLIPVLSY